MNPLVLLKHLFIPHDKNDYKPHFFRELSVAILLFCSIFLLGASYGSSFFTHKTILGASVAASVLIDLTNESRLAYNEAPLVKSEKLESAAKLKGEDMVKMGYFAHESPSGVTPWHWFKQVGYDFLYAGENLAVNFTESADVNKAWLDSPLHRENLLNVKFHEIGIATVEGVYEDNPTIFIVQMFGTPVYASNLSPETKGTITEKTIESSNTKITSSSTLLALGDVKGEATGTVETFLPIVNTSELAVVKNTKEGAEEATTSTQFKKYSTWYGRLVFGGPHYVDVIYKGLIILVAFALVTMILIEIKKQHPKHILYGVVLLVTLIIFVFINQGFF